LADMGEVSLESTKKLGKDLLTSRKNVNNAPLLLSILSNSSTPSAATTECRLEALHSLHAFFIPLLRTGTFFAAARKKAKKDIEAVKDDTSGDPSDGDKAVAKAEAVYRLWVWNKYRDFKKSMFRIVAQPVNAQVLQVWDRPLCALLTDFAYFPG
jgi:hypothetical protein